MKCGIPIPCASARATRTACAEQHDASASLAWSAHSSSVTATAPSPVRSAATAESTPPLIATSVRRSSSGTAASGPRGEPERAVQRVGGQVGRVQLARREPAELAGDRARPDARGVEHRRARHERDDRRARGDHRAAARGLEAGLGHPRAVDPDPDGHEVAARGAAGGSHESAGGHVPLPLREIQMLGEALGAHAPSVGAARSSSGRARRSCARTSCRGACRPPSRS